MPDKQKKKALFEALKRQRWKCCWCGCQLKLPVPGQKAEPNWATREHMRPQLFGGTFRKGNIRAACWKCNTERGKRMMESLKQEQQRIEELRAKKDAVASKEDG